MSGVITARRSAGRLMARLQCPTMRTVLLSYSRGDRRFAEAASRMLVRSGIECWLEVQEPMVLHVE
jgi:hypothetical protein